MNTALNYSELAHIPAINESIIPTAYREETEFQFSATTSINVYNISSFTPTSFQFHENNGNKTMTINKLSLDYEKFFNDLSLPKKFKNILKNNHEDNQHEAINTSIISCRNFEKFVKIAKFIKFPAICIDDNGLVNLAWASKPIIHQMQIKLDNGQIIQKNQRIIKKLFNITFLNNNKIQVNFKNNNNFHAMSLENLHELTKELRKLNNDIKSWLING